MNPKSVAAALVFLAVTARELKCEVDGPVADIVHMLVRAMKQLGTRSWVGARIHPLALAQFDDMPLDEVTIGVLAVIEGFEDGSLITHPRFGRFFDAYQNFLDVPVYAEVVK